MSICDSIYRYDSSFKNSTLIPKISDAHLRNLKLPEIVKTPDNKLLSINNKDKYAEKDSLYLDVGTPLLNGKIDTITQSMSSNNNSLLLSQMGGGSNGNVGSNSGSISMFVENTNGSGKKSNRPSFRYNGAGQSFLKAAIFRNMQKNSENIEEFKDGMSPGMIKINGQDTRRGSIGSGTGSRNESPDSGEYVDETQSDNSQQLQNNVEKMKIGTHDKHPSKMLSQGQQKNK